MSSNRIRQKLVFASSINVSEPNTTVRPLRPHKHVLLDPADPPQHSTPRYPYRDQRESPPHFQAFRQ